MTNRQAGFPSTSSSPTPDQFTNATWDDIAPFYDALATRNLEPADTDTIEAWLSDWNALDVALTEATLMADFASSRDTADTVKERAHLRFSSEIGPRRNEQVVRLADKLLATGYTRPDLETTLRRFRTDSDIFREESIPLEQGLSALNARYNKLTGSMSVEWQGNDVPISRLNPFMLDPDRDLRERAFRLQF
jgi:oligoendopeptidase F